MNSNRMLNGLFVAMALFAGALSAGCEGFGGGSSLPAMSANPRNAVIDALATLRQAAESADPVVRSNAIEALSNTVGDKEGGLYLQALNEANPMIQFAGAMAVGDTQYAPAKEKLSQMADQAGPDKRVYAAVIYALYRLGDTSHMPDMVRLLQHRETEVRADAVMVLGKIGEPSAIYPLRSVLTDEREPRVELNIVEALALLGEGDSSTRLERYARQRFFDQQLLIIPVIAHVRPERGRMMLNEMMTARQPITVRVAAAGALAQLGDNNIANYRLCLLAAQNPAGLLGTAYGKGQTVNAVEQSKLRQIGIISLGWMGRSAAVDSLLPMLNDQDGTTRVAAAMSILRLLPTQLAGTSASKTQPVVTPSPATRTSPESAPVQPPVKPAAQSEPAASTVVPAAASKPVDTDQTPRPKLRIAGPKD